MVELVFEAICWLVKKAGDSPGDEEIAPDEAGEKEPRIRMRSEVPKEQQPTGKSERKTLAEIVEEANRKRGK